MDDAEDAAKPNLTAASVDPAQGSVTFSGTELTFVPAADFNGAAEISYTVADTDGATASATVTVTVDPVNDAPTIGGIVPAATIAATGGTVDLSSLSTADVDGTTPTFLLGNPDDVPAGITIAGTQIVVAPDTAPGIYGVEVNAFDGEDVSLSAVTVQVTVEAPVVVLPFETIYLQAEADSVEAQLVVADTDGNSNDTALRTIESPEPNGNRPDFGGTGYADFGDFPGDKLVFTFDVPAGDYVLHVRYAVGGTNARPLDLILNDTPAPQPQMAFVSTDPDGSGAGDGFDFWGVEEVTLTLTDGVNTIELAIPAGTNTGPNIDAVALAAPGATVEFPITDTTADAGGDLAAATQTITIGLVDAVSLPISLTGLDDDITTVEVSTDGGTNFAPVTLLGPITGGTAQITVDLSALTAGPVDLLFQVTDTLNNTATAGTAVELVDIDGSVVTEIQAETFAIGPDTDGDTAEATNQPDFTGTGFLDMGGEIGDAVSFEVEVPEDGTYTLVFRYAMSNSSGDRPMTLTINGQPQPDLEFDDTGGFEVWNNYFAEVSLEAGSPNVIQLANVIANGPNIDRVAILLAEQVANTPPTAAPGSGAGLEDAPLITIEIVDLIADVEDGEPAITAASSANGTVVITGTSLEFTPDANFNGDAVIDYTVTDSDGATASAQVTVAVAPVNDAPTLGGSVDPATATTEGGIVNLSGLVAADVDETAPTLEVRAAPGETLPDGVEINGEGNLVIPAGLEPGNLELEVFATDGELDFEFVPLTVTIEEPLDLSYVVPANGEIVIQLENRDGSIVINDEDISGGGINNSDLTQFRDSLNPELNLNGTVQEGNGKTGGLWDGKTGEGYLDMGQNVGDQATFDVTVAEAGEYTFLFRYNNGGSAARPLAIAVEGSVQQTPQFVNSQIGWTEWLAEPVTLTLEAGTSTISMTNTVENGPNLDSVTITAPDTSADADGVPLALTGPQDAVEAADTAAIAFNVTGRDADIVTVELSFDGGTTRTDVTSEVDANGNFTIDGTTLGAGPQTATVIVTDATGNEAQTDVGFEIAADVVNTAPVVGGSSVQTLEDNAITVELADLISDDTDADEDLTITAEATNGTVALNGTELTFTPEPISPVRRRSLIEPWIPSARSRRMRPSR